MRSPRRPTTCHGRVLWPEVASRLVGWRLPSRGVPVKLSACLTPHHPPSGGRTAVRARPRSGRRLPLVVPSCSRDRISSAWPPCSRDRERRRHRLRRLSRSRRNSRVFASRARRRKPSRAGVANNDGRGALRCLARRSTVRCGLETPRSLCGKCAATPCGWTPTEVTGTSRSPRNSCVWSFVIASFTGQVGTENPGSAVQSRPCPPTFANHFTRESRKTPISSLAQSH
jgi:hypothetical protein